MDDLLGNLLTLPPDTTDWADLVRAFASHNHPELPASVGTPMVTTIWG